MKFEYTLTIADLKEHNAAIAPMAKPVRPYRSLIIWAPAFILAVFNAIPVQLIYGRLALQLADPRPPQNLWVTLAPSLCVLSFLIAAVLFQPPKRNFKPGTKPSARYGGCICFASYG